MAGDDDFQIWLGLIGQDRPLRHRLAAGARRAGRRGRGRSSFSGARLGRGAGLGRVLGSRSGDARLRIRRVVVKTRIVRLGGKGLGAAKAHLRYLERDGTTREGGRGTLYGPGSDEADGKAFLERGLDDRHQFRFIVAPEDGAQYEDLKPLVRRLMDQAEKDLGTQLDWVAVDHFNTGHPHSHVIVRGKDDLGKDLVIAREYLTQGLRERAGELVSLDLGPRTDQEIRIARVNEIRQERFTDLDRRLLRSTDERGLVQSFHRDGSEQALRAKRLQVLGRMGLANELRTGGWQLDDDLEAKLRRMGEVGDIIRTMNRAMRERLPERSPADRMIHDPSHGSPLIGRVVERGLSDEHADRHYLIVDGTDGFSRYVEIGVHDGAIPQDGIVRVTPRPVAIRDVDRTVAEVAAANGGRYTIDAHLRHDAMASQAFAERHVRRLEAIRRTTGGVTREADGTWVIAPDHLERAEAYEQSLAKRSPVVIDVLSERPLEQLPGHDGATWLDRELTSKDRVSLDRGFGADVRKALTRRLQWLVEQGLAEGEGESARLRANLVSTLQQRELRRTAAQLSQELGLPFAEASRSEPIEGTMTRSLQLGDSKFAVIENSRKFTLVPWRPVLERAIGKQVSGLVREGGIDWQIGRSRGLSIGM